MEELDFDMDDVVEGVDEDDLLGALDDMLGVGWPARRGGKRRRRRGGLGALRRATRTLSLSPYAGAPRVLAKPPLVGPAPGVPQISGLYIPLGLGSRTFTSLLPTSFVFIERPEKPVRPRRLWINVLRSAGAAAIGVDVSDIKIGTKSMLAGLLAIPAEQFSPGAFSTSYNLFDSAVPGVSVSVSIALSAAPAVGETVFVSISMDCDSLG